MMTDWQTPAYFTHTHTSVRKSILVLYLDPLVSQSLELKMDWTSLYALFICVSYVSSTKLHEAARVKVTHAGKITFNQYFIGFILKDHRSVKNKANHICSVEINSLDPNVINFVVQNRENRSILMLKQNKTNKQTTHLIHLNCN